MSTDLFSKNLPPLRRESWCYCYQCRPSCPLKTQVFLNIASCFQTVIWCCEHPQPVKLWYSFRLAGGVTQWVGEMEWTLSAQRHPAMAPELQEPHHHPLRALNYYHIYTLGSPLCARFKFWSVLSCLLTYLWNFEKHSSKILFWESFTVSLKNWNLFSGVMRYEFVCLLNSQLNFSSCLV